MSSPPVHPRLSTLATRIRLSSSGLVEDPCMPSRGISVYGAVDDDPARRLGSRA